MGQESGGHFWADLWALFPLFAGSQGGASQPPAESRRKAGEGAQPATFLQDGPISSGAGQLPGSKTKGL
jgi:hypothetical protein